MLSIQQYKKLQEYKELGLSKVKVSEKLNLSYKTICNWWDKDQAFFNAINVKLRMDKSVQLRFLSLIQF